MSDLPGWFYPWGFFDPPCNTPSEFSHGRGLRHPCLRDASPDVGGMYAAKCPPMPKEHKGKSRHSYPGDIVRP